MPQRPPNRHSLPLIWGFSTRRGRPASSLSLASKSSADEMEVPPTPSQGVGRHSMPSMTAHVEHVQRVAAGPLSTPPPAISRPRPETGTPAGQNVSRLSRTPSYHSTAGLRTSQIPQSGRIHRVFQRLRFRRQKKKGASGHSQLSLKLALVAFCMTAVLYIILAFSLSGFPNFLHIFFIGALFLEFGFVVKALLKHARNRNRKARVPPTTNTDAPPPGTIIHGAQNWEDEHEREAARAAEGLDLEEIGVEEALKPVPPAYGVYRGSVRIADSDITWVRSAGMSEHRLYDIPDAVPAGTGRPPSYGVEARVEAA